MSGENSFWDELQSILYHVGDTEKRDPDKPWDADVLDQLAELMERYGLVPEREDDQ